MRHHGDDLPTTRGGTARAVRGGVVLLVVLRGG
jgi:hypothetical protein